jgi:hypothetical protein
MTRRHGRRRHIVRDCGCTMKSICFTTWDAAMSAVASVPDAERAYRGTCCGHYHITRLSIDEFAQRVAEYCVQEQAFCDTVVLSIGEEAGDEAETDPEAAARAWIECTEPRTRGGGPGDPAIERWPAPRFPPSPAAFARRLKARSDQGRRLA